MLDTKRLRKDLDGVIECLNKRGFEFDRSAFEAFEVSRRALQEDTERLQNQRNVLSKAIGQAKAKGEDVDALMVEVAGIAENMEDKKQALLVCQDQLNEFLASVPNVPHESVPFGKTEADNPELRRVGEVLSWDFEVKDHLSIGEALQIIDMQAGSQLSGSRFALLRGQGARLQRALIQMMLNKHTDQHGYEEVYVPYLVRDKALFGTTQLPKFREDLFQVGGEWGLSLIPTAEVPVTNLVADALLDAETLPIKRVCHTPCFRSEAGSYGKDTRGLIRLHQFEKVELVQCVEPEFSYDALEELTGHAESLLKDLEIPYRVISLCTGDLGFGAAKTYDLEVWVPSQNTYREVSSCSNFEDFQARRMMARYRSTKDKKPHYLHTLNGSGLALPRTIVALLENFQQKDGSVAIPDVLRPYMNQQAAIKREDMVFTA